jgi:hypothetical protein
MTSTNEDLKIEGVQICMPNLPDRNKLFVDTLNYMVEAESNKTIKDKETFVLDCVLALYPNLTGFELTLATQLIKLVISSVIQISHNPRLIKKINETFCCWL